MATILAVFVDGRSRVFETVGVLALGFVVLFDDYAVLRPLLTNPARSPPEDRPRADVPPRRGVGALDPEHRRSALRGPLVRRWRGTAEAGDRRAG